MPVDPVQALIREINDLKRRIKTLETAPSQQNMTVDRGATRILSPEGLTIGAPGNTAGSQVVYGRLTIDGIMDGEGDFDWSGPWDFSGPGAMTGPITATGEWTQIGEWHLNGDGDITGDVDITGTLNLLSQLIVSSLGKITVGNMVIDPADGGKITFPGGASLRADVGNGIQMQIGNVKISAQANFVMLTVGTRSIVINSSGISAGLPTAPLSNWPGRQVGDVVSNTSGDLFRIV